MSIFDEAPNKKNMAKVYIGVGSNMGDRASLIEEAKKKLMQMPGITLLNESSVYETEPVDGPGGKYLNAAWEIETDKSARKLLDDLLFIETSMGRVRKERNESRPIDLDILFYGDQIIEEPGLTIPHPRLHERLFALSPLSELCAENFIHPKLKKTICEILMDLSE